MTRSVWKGSSRRRSETRRSTPLRRRPRRVLIVAATLLLAAACSSAEDPGSGTATSDVCGHLARTSTGSGARGVIAYASDASGGVDLWLMQPDGSHQTPLVSGDGAQYFPAWSPDGATLAYTGGATANLDAGPTDICRISLNDGQVTNLTDTEGTSELAPSWSPDGATLAYTSITDDGSTIFVMAADGSDPPCPTRLRRQLRVAELVP